MATAKKTAAPANKRAGTPAAKGKAPAKRTTAAKRAPDPARTKPTAAATRKPAKEVKPKAPPVAVAKIEKAPKLKLVRDSFTMPRSDIDLIDTLKNRAIDFKRPAKKSELLRAGLHALAAMSDAQLKGALDQLLPLRPGRPKKGE